jgi:hypothetical protein
MREACEQFREEEEKGDTVGELFRYLDEGKRVVT